MQRLVTDWHVAYFVFHKNIRLFHSHPLQRLNKHVITYIIITKNYFQKLNNLIETQFNLYS